jgi:hypothetical protein
MKKLVPVSGLLTVFVASSLASASPTLTLSSPTNLSTLTLGQELEVDVILSGLPANDYIFVLNSGVLFSSSLFTPVADPNNSSGLTPGSILNASQTANFNAASSLKNAASGNFSDSSPSPSTAIGQNGLFYSFLLQADGAGSGTISFDPNATQYAADDTGFALAALATGDPLAFTIAPASASAPEPSTLGLLGLVGSLATVAAAMRRKQIGRSFSIGVGRTY